jgi:uncharacterized cupin superfamily protein
MAKIDQSKIQPRIGSRYPAPHDAPCNAREVLPLTEAAGLSQFGANRVRLPPGAWSSQRHWHSHEDEFVMVLSGEATLVTDAGDQVLVAGDCAAFPAGIRDGHCLQNRSQVDCVFLVVGTRHDEDHGEYSDIDMKFNARRYADGAPIFVRKDGTPFP